jgi:hypothetical protein
MPRFLTASLLATVRSQRMSVLLLMGILPPPGNY